MCKQKRLKYLLDVVMRYKNANQQYHNATNDILQHDSRTLSVCFVVFGLATRSR